MKHIKLFCIISILMYISIGESFAQVKDTLYYNKEWKGVETKKEAEYYRIVTFNSNGIPKGEILDYYKSGELQAKSESAKFINRFDDSKSIFVGKSILYYKSGQMEEEYTHNAEGKVVGNYNDYYKSGKIKARATFDLNGKIIGTAIYLYENGQVSKEIPYSKGKINGTVIYYSKTGIETAEINYVNGVPKYDWYIAFDKQGKSHKYNIKTNKPYTDKKEIKIFYKDGKTFKYYRCNGITVTMQLSVKQDYGKYYIAYIAIANLTGKSFNFNPGNIKATLMKDGEKFIGKVLSNNEYMRKVKNRQEWSDALVSFGQSYSANHAGYSYSSTTSNTTGYSNSSVNASGYYGNTYGSISGNSSTYGSATTNSYTKSYNGAVNYAARQNAQQNINNYENELNKERNVLNQGYLKLNTIDNGQRIIGQINIKYKKADRINITIPVNGIDYNFIWNSN